MAQIIQPQPTWQEALGSGLGSGIQTGVQTILEQKLKAMQQEQTSNQRFKTLEGLSKAGVLGKEFTPEVLQLLKGADADTFQTLLKQKLQAPQNAAFRNQVEIAANPEAQNKLDLSGLTDEQAYKVAKLRNQTAKESSEKQLTQDKFIETHNKPFEDKLAAEFAKNDELRPLIAEWEQLLNSGKVSSGIYGKTVPRFLQNAASQRFDKIGDEVAVINAGTGNVTGIGKIRFKKGAKPELSDQLEAQRAGIEQVKQQVENRDKKKKILYLMREKNDFRPIKGEAEKFTKLVEAFDQLPEPEISKYPDGTEALDDSTNKPFAQIINGQWQPI